MVYNTKGCKQETHILVITLPTAQSSLGAGSPHQSVFFFSVSPEEEVMADFVTILLVSILHISLSFPAVILGAVSRFLCVVGEPH